MGSYARRTSMMPCVCAVLALGLAGCGHKQVRVHIPVASPVDLETLSIPDDEIEQVPQPDVAPLQWPEPAKPPVRRRPPAPADANVPSQPNETPAPELSIGALSTGGDATPQSQQQARDLIASVERRITGLPARVADRQRPQVRQSRDYLDKAKKALNTGDTDGAMNLANKAKVLMDELESR
jgi:hypothetical protein